MLLPSAVDSASLTANFIAAEPRRIHPSFIPEAYLIKFSSFQFGEVDHRCVSKDCLPYTPYTQHISLTNRAMKVKKQNQHVGKSFFLWCQTHREKRNSDILLNCGI